MAEVTDPAVEAAQRAWRTATHGRKGDLPSSEMMTALVTGAAREMAKPIRELHEFWNSEAVLPPEAWQILDQLARLIFTSEELER